MVPANIVTGLQGVSADVAIISGTALAMPDIERSSHKEYHDAARWSETSRRKGGF
jgi:hypothetical protein